MDLYKFNERVSVKMLMSGDAMSNAIAALETAGVTGTALWAEVGAAAGLIGTIVVFVFGYRIIAKILKGAAKGKVRL